MFSNKVFHPLTIREPEGYNRSSLFESLPTVILRLIQQYLRKYDYRQLLNTNAKTFQHVKHETVYYNFIRYDKWQEKIQGFHNITDQINYFIALCNSVKDKSQQISLKIESATKEIVQQYGHLMPGILKLDFQASRDFWRNRPNMGMFCNIYYLRLENVRGINSLSGLTGIKILEVYISDSITAIDFIPGLQRLIIYCLPNLQEITQYGNIPELIIDDCSELKFEGLGNHEKFSYKGYTGIKEDIQLCRNVKYLSMESRVELDTLPQLPNLIYLVLEGNDSLFDPSYFPNL
jgi:hypothetical protein